MDTTTTVALAGNFLLLLTIIIMMFQTREMVKQSAGNALATRSSVYQSITDTMIDIDRMFVERPELRGHFYDNEAPPQDPVERTRVTATAELLIDFIDNVVTQAPHLPEYLNGPWRAYICSVMQSSQALRDFWTENRTWYSDELQELLDPQCLACPGTPAPGGLVPPQPGEAPLPRAAAP